MTQVMKRMTACLMALLLAMSFAACTPVEEQPTTHPSTTPTSAPTIDPTSPPPLPPAPPQTGPTLPQIPFVNANTELEQLRLPGYDASWVVKFTDRFGGYETAQNLSDLSEILSAIGELGKDMELPEGYDDAFFQDNYLLLIPMQSNSGSVRYEAGIAVDTEKIQITLNGKMPEVGTADMADWLLLIPLSRTLYPNADQIEITTQSIQNREQNLNIKEK